MNPVLENIRNRRSVRSFEDKTVPRDVLEAVIEAANQAPSGSNSQPWRFVVVESDTARRKLLETAGPRYRKWLSSMPEAFQEMRRRIDEEISDSVYYSAPAIVFVIGQGGSSIFDCPLACENIMLAAHSLGLGSCWVFIGGLAAGDPDVRKMLDLQEGEKVYGPIVLGYPKGDFPPSPSKKPAQVKWIS